MQYSFLQILQNAIVFWILRMLGQSFVMQKVRVAKFSETYLLIESMISFSKFCSPSRVVISSIIRGLLHSGHLIGRLLMSCRLFVSWNMMHSRQNLWPQFCSK